MSEYNFEPDYEAWWNKPDVGKQEIIWLCLGINPDDIKKAGQLGHIENPSHEDRNWLFDFDEYRGSFLGNRFKEYDELLVWKDDKALFVKDAYDFRMAINETFLNYLVQIGALKRNQKWEAYKDTDKYILDFKALVPENIKAEDDAFSILLGLEPEHFKRFCDLSARAGQPADKRGYTPYIYFEADEKWFFSSYHEFLKQAYSHLSSPSVLIGALKRAKELNLWKNDFKDYCQGLHDSGFIFKKEVYENLELEPDYSSEGWAYKFYTYWVQKPLWTLEEGSLLFKGECPLFKGERPRGGTNFEDLSQNKWASYGYNLIKDDFYDRYEKMDSLIEESIKSGELDAQEIGNVWKFRPLDIVNWLLNKTRHKPPKLLLDVLGIEEKQNDTRVSESEKFSQAKTQDADIKSQRTKALKDFENLLILKSVNLKEMPFTQNEIAQYLKEQPAFNHISETSIVAHYIKKQANWEFRKGSAPKNRPSLQSVISTN